MAKISARGNHKVAQASRTTIDDYGEHRTVIVLRSDSKVLYAVHLRSHSDREKYGSRGWHRGGYSIGGTLSPTPERTSLERFERYAAQHGFTMEPGR